jgi:16S rRNA (guanine527-N7)-methyltransferase
VRPRARPPRRRPAAPDPRGAGGNRPAPLAPAELAATLDEAAAALGLELPAAFAGQIGTYLDELERWERIGALTAYRDRAARVCHLVVESLMLLAALPEPAAPLLDIGSGAGVPGLVLKLARPDWPVVLIEAARRRANFLRHVSRVVALRDVTVIEGRAETCGTGSMASRFRTVTMRAVAGGASAERLAAPFLDTGGALVLPLGPGAATGVPRGTVREITLAVPGQLPWRRRFLIIPAAELALGVPRGTRAGTVPQPRSREPEGRRR